MQVSLLLLSASSLFCAESTGPRSYGGTDLYASSLLTIKSPQSYELEIHTQPWLESHQEVLAQLLKRKKALSQFKEEELDRTAALQASGLVNEKKQALSNYLFKTDQEQAMIKISGLVSRINNLYFANGKNKRLSDQSDPEELDSLEIVPTYQTASRYAHYLLVKQCLEREGISTVKVPTTALTTLPSDDQRDVDDDHSIIVEEYVPGTELLDTSSHVETLSEKTIYELLLVIKQAGLWCLDNNLHTREGQIYLFDIEQPDNSNPVHFFNLKRKKYEWNVSQGLISFSALFKKESKQYLFLKNLVVNDPEIQLNQFFESTIKPHFLS